MRRYGGKDTDMKKTILTIIMMMCVMCFTVACGSKKEAAPAATKEVSSSETEDAGDTENADMESDEPEEVTEAASGETQDREEAKAPEEEKEQRPAILDFFEMTMGEVADRYGDDLALDLYPGMQGDVLSVYHPDLVGLTFYPYEWGDPFDRNTFMASRFMYLVTVGEGWELLPGIPSDGTWTQIREALEKEGIKAEDPVRQGDYYATQFTCNDYEVSLIWFADPASTPCVQVTAYSENR